MNKYFLYIVVIVSFFYVICFCLKDVVYFPPTPAGELYYLKNFKSDFPHIKQLGFYSDYPYFHTVLYRIQNTVMPVFVENSVNYDTVFCYSENELCQKFIINGSAILLKKYSDNLFLLKKPEVKQ